MGPAAGVSLFPYLCIKSKKLHMKSAFFCKSVVTGFIFFLVSQMLFAQAGEPWTTKELMAPEALASMISNPKSAKPVIYNIGPLGDIKGAVNIGSTNTKANLDKLKKALEKVPKDKMVVLYCGCCPFRSCPNIRPAFSLLKEMGFKSPRLLNLKQNLKVDWIDYGYPMN